MDQAKIRELRLLSDEALERRLREGAALERKLQSEMLWHLREVDVRKLYAKRGFPSLYEYVIKYLGYSESSAFRRISAMRLVKELPEIEEKIESGALKLSQLASIQAFARAEKSNVGRVISSEEKRKLLHEVENRSQRETVSHLFQAAASIRSVTPERVRQLDSGSEIRFFAARQLVQKFERVREVAAHRIRFTSEYSDLFDVMSDLALEHLDPMQKGQGQKAPSTSKATKTVGEGPALVGRDGFQPALIPHTASRYIPEHIRRVVWKRDQGQCQYGDLGSGRICGSRFGLQIDHIKRIRDGGSSTDAANLQLLCGPHNRLRG